MNKESLQSMLLDSQRSQDKEGNLIETIKIISKENGELKEQVKALQQEIDCKNLNKIDREVQAVVESQC